MDSRDSFPTVGEWKGLLWQAFAAAAFLTLVLVGLSAVLRVVFLVAVLYGLALPIVAFFLAIYALRVEYGEPADPVEETNPLVFPFTHLAGYPQLVLLLVLGGGTVLLSPAVAFLTGNLDFSTAEGPAGPGPVAGGPPTEPPPEPPPRPVLPHLPRPPRPLPPGPPARPGTLPPDFSPGEVRVVAVTTSSDWRDKEVGPLAFDANARTKWNSGQRPPGWIEADLGQPTALAELRLIHYTFPDCDATHEVWVSDQPIREDRSGARKVHAFEGFVRNRQILTFTFPEGTTARYLQIHTTRSRSWPSWFEIAIDGK